MRVVPLFDGAVEQNLPGYILRWPEQREYLTRREAEADRLSRGASGLGATDREADDQAGKEKEQGEVGRFHGRLAIEVAGDLRSS